MSLPSHLCSDPTDPDGDAVLDVTFEITSRGYGPDATDPGSPPEFHITSVVDVNGNEWFAALTTDQHEALEAEIADGFDFRQHYLDAREMGL